MQPIKQNKKPSARPANTIFLFLAVAVTLLGDSSLYVLLPIHATDLGISFLMVGVLLSINRFVRIFTNYLAVFLHAKVNSYVLLSMSVMIASLSTYVYGLASPVWAFVAARIVWGCSWSVLRYESMVNIAAQENDQNKGKLAGVFNSFTRIGSLIALVLGGMLVEWTDYRTTFQIFSILTLGVGLWMVFLSKTIPSKQVESSRQANTFSRTPIRTKSTMIGPLSCYGLTFVNALTGVGLLVSTLSYVMLMQFGERVDMFGYTLGISSAAGFLGSTVWFHSIVLSVAFGKLSDQYGRTHLVLITSIVFSSMLALMVFVPELEVFMLLVFIAFAATVGLNSLLAAIAIDHHNIGSHKNVIANQTTLGDIGSALGALLGYTFIVFAGYRAVYLIASFLLIAFVVNTLRVLRRVKR